MDPNIDTDFFWPMIETGVQRVVCFFLRDTPWLWFEPGFSEIDGAAESNGWKYPVDKNKPAGTPGSGKTGCRHPDLYLSHKAPTSGRKGILVGEIKVDISDFYHTWFVPSPSGRPSYRPGQLLAISRHAQNYQYPPWLVVLFAWYDGSQQEWQRLTQELMEAQVAGIIVQLKP